jgi:hypothetical protein
MATFVTSHLIAGRMTTPISLGEDMATDAQTAFLRAREIVWSMQAIDAQEIAATKQLQTADPHEKAALLHKVSDIEERRLEAYRHYLECCQAFQTAVEQLRQEGLDSLGRVGRFKR